MASSRPSDLVHLTGLSTLDDPVRRRLYSYVSEADAPVSREQAATVADIGRTLAAYHLDKLADAGLLMVVDPRTAGRGVGRPAKLYQCAAQELSVSVPPRDYALLAGVLATAVRTDTDGAVRAAIHEAAHQAGMRAVTAPGADLSEALHGCGYQPHHASDGHIELRNCPFHSVATQYLDVVCDLNVHLIEGVIEASGSDQARAELDPRPGRCCVVIHDSTETARS
ncbi:MAG: helix-turn-helix domain-containing protein [Mycobacteriaceae bacterium]